VISGVDGGMGWLREGGVLQGIWMRMPGAEASHTPAVCIRSIGKLAMSVDELKGIKLPVETVIGDRDPMRQLYVAPLLEVRRDWPVVDIKDAGHIDCIMKPQFREALADWLAKHPAKPPAAPKAETPKQNP
jgi:hypothetical protein